MVEWVEARQFGPECASAGNAVVVHCDGREFQIRTASDANDDVASLRVSVTEMRVARTGFNEKGLELRWRGESGDSGDSVLHILDLSAVERLVKQLPASLTRQFDDSESERTQRKRRRAVAWVGLAIFFAAPLIALIFALIFSASLTAWIVDRIPPEFEADIGRSSLVQLSGDGELSQSGEAWNVINEIGRSLVGESVYDYEVYLAADDSINAFALPGGIIVVNSGLLNATDTPEELAGVIAHEISHVELRHGLSSMVKHMGVATLWTLALGDFSGLLGSEAALQLLSLKFSRDAETEADNGGFNRLLAAGINPSGMAAFFDTLSEQGAAIPQWMSTHPASDNRADALRQRANAAGREFENLGLRFPTWPPVE